MRCSLVYRRSGPLTRLGCRMNRVGILAWLIRVGRAVVTECAVPVVAGSPVTVSLDSNSKVSVCFALEHLLEHTHTAHLVCHLATLGIRRRHRSLEWPVLLVSGHDSTWLSHVRHAVLIGVTSKPAVEVHARVEVGRLA